MSQEQNAANVHYGRQMMTMMAIVALAPLCIVTAVMMYSYSVSYSEKVTAHLQVMAERHAQDIDYYLNEKLANIRMQAVSFTVEELSDQFIISQRLAALQEVYRGTYNDLGLVSQSGVQVSYAGPYQLASADYSEAEWFQSAISDQSFISDVFLGIRRIPHFIVTVRMSREAREWLLRSTIDFAEFNSVVKDLQVGQTGAAFIINRAGEFQTERRAETSVDPNVLQLLSAQDFAGISSRVLEHENAQGEDYFYVSAPLKGGQWILVVQQQRSDALVHLYTARAVSLAILAVGSLGILLVVFFLTRRMERKLVRVETEQKTMQKQMVETGKLAAIGELAAGIAHEINNPVAIMIESAGWIDDLLKGGNLGEDATMAEINSTLQEIILQGRRCREITHKLLSFARKTDPRLKEVDMAQLLEEIISLVAQKANYGNVAIHTEFDEPLPPIMASATEMQQVMLNLINNAIDAISRDDGEIIVRAYRMNDSLFIDVADNGQGIPAADLSRIFEPFYTTKPVGKGTGLGLSICYGIVHKMGGEITVDSEVNEGTTFHVRLPLEPVKPS